MFDVTDAAVFPVTQWIEGLTKFGVFARPCFQSPQIIISQAQLIGHPSYSFLTIYYQLFIISIVLSRQFELAQE